MWKAPLLKCKTFERRRVYNSISLCCIVSYSSRKSRGQFPRWPNLSPVARMIAKEPKSQSSVWCLNPRRCNEGIFSMHACARGREIAGEAAGAGCRCSCRAGSPLAPTACPRVCGGAAGVRLWRQWVAVAMQIGSAVEGMVFQMLHSIVDYCLWGDWRAVSVSRRPWRRSQAS
jgi:hypothetical protein